MLIKKQRSKEMTQKQKKYTASTFTIFIFVALLMIGIFYVNDVSSQSQNSTSNKIQAQPTSSEIRTKKISDPIWKQEVTTKQLVMESPLIVIGKPISNLCVPSEDNYEVVTEYKFQTAEIIKGQMQAGNIITVRFPGGLILQENGSGYSVVSSGFKKMKNNAVYLLFLGGGDYQHLSTTRGPQGVFEFTNNSDTLISYGVFAKDDFKPGTNEENLVAAEFLREVRNTVR